MKMEDKMLGEIIQEKVNDSIFPGLGIATLNNFNDISYYGAGVLEKGTTNHVNENTAFHICSMSKMITTIVVLKLEQEGLLNIDAPINNLFADWKLEDSEIASAELVTLRLLLAHQGGMVDDENGFRHYQKGTVYPDMKAILNGVTPYNRKKAVIEYIPGSRFEYSDMGYCIIQKIVEDVMNDCFENIVQKYIFEPLHLKNSFFASSTELENRKEMNIAVGYDDCGNPFEEKRVSFPYAAASGMYSTSIECLRIVRDLVNSWKKGAGIILNQEQARKMLSPLDIENPWFGLGVFLQGEDCFISKGWDEDAQCMLKVYLKEEKAIVVMSNCNPGVEQEESLIGEMITLFEGRPFMFVEPT